LPAFTKIFNFFLNPCKNLPKFPKYPAKPALLSNQEKENASNMSTPAEDAVNPPKSSTGPKSEAGNETRNATFYSVLYSARDFIRPGDTPEPSTP
jgi:hypothetical protein